MRRIFCEDCRVPMEYHPQVVNNSEHDDEGAVLVLVTLSHHECPECGTVKVDWEVERDAERSRA